MDMQMNLNGEWTLSWCREQTPMPPEETWPRIPAAVPGNVELDLFRAGIEPDPYYAENEYLYRKYEFCAWRFTRRAFINAAPASARVYWVFEGLNCIADVYINGQWAGHAENALIAHEFDVTELLAYGRENEFAVRIASAANRALSCDYPVHLGANEGSDEYTRLRMPPHSFGWDIMPRFVSAGMWRGVRLESRTLPRIEQAYYATVSASESLARVVYKYRFRAESADTAGYSVRVYLDGALVADKPARFVSGEGSFHVAAPRLWWPRGYGEAHLYTARMELVRNGEVIDARTERLGLRTAEVAHKMAANDAGEFLILVNGVKIMAKGSNWVPMDAMHSRDRARYARAVDLFCEAGCNIMRLWGGNVYEDHALFDLCDENGILVWHDFAMACAVYPQDPEFLKTMHDEAQFVIRKLRNHACILLWAGDNEVDEGYAGRGYLPASNVYNAVTREALPRAVRENDPYRMFLPSSPYIDQSIARYDVPEQHNWGPRAWFKDDFYRLSRAHFVSECGYHGCPSPETLKKFIPESELWPMGGGAWTAHNSEYRAGGYKRDYDRNQLMADQVRIMFGFMPDTLEEFSLLSQFTQAEAFKFFIEHTRAMKWRRTGVIWWNMLDGWPQISDAVVDWYYTKKRAFFAIKRAQAPLCLMLDEHQAWSHQAILLNDGREDALVAFRAVDAQTGETLLSGEALSRANENTTVGEIRVLPGEKRLILLECRANGARNANHYVTGFPPFDAETAKRWMRQIDEWAEAHT